ncbi:triacylglycerol lipase [Ancylostoma caninum]|uniref:Triacylglycerol lipase n=1 Tax=Ancylostoma caninum TaxID=29170 RepID=A0A368FQN6_ANCCA|nr:triacylglycerol lipase [Ancylostoma caninum]
MSFMLPLLYSLFLDAVANERTTNRVEVKSEGPLNSEWVTAAAYAEDPNPCLRQHNASLVYRITLPCDYIKDECWGYVAMRDGWIIVAFRGTRTKIQLITELIESMSEPKRKLRAGGSVQHYFYVALEAVWKQMNAVIRKLRATYPNYSIMFTGHSLGGALASLASTIYAHRNPILKDRIHLITFGQPRVGNFEYAETHNRLVPNSWRIVHKYDLVAHLPACAFQVFSRSCISLFNHSPYHHGTEVWFPSNMTENSMFRICEGTPLFEDNNCSNGYYLHYGVKDHIRYFEHEVSEYGINGCIDPPDSDGLSRLEVIR